MNYVEGIKIGGATAAQIPCIKGSGVPTTETAGAVGCLYMDTNTSKMYKCTAVKDGVYTWEEQGGGYYSTTREEVGEIHDNIKSTYIWGLYDELMEKYPGKVQKKEHTNDDGTFTNYEYVISTGDYPSGAYSFKYEDDSDHINKPKYLVLSAIHGTERKTAISTYRFIRDVLSGHNVPQSFREGVIISVLPVGNPSGFDAFTRNNAKDVDVNRNFDWHWEVAKDNDDNVLITNGSSAASEDETQAIAKWLTDNSDAELFIDFHNNGAMNEKVLILGLSDDSISDTAKKVALRGVDRIIPFWRDVIRYPLIVEAEGVNEAGTGKDVKERAVIFSYSASADVGGGSYGYAQKVLGICSIALETVSHYGSHSEWIAADKKTYSPEAIAMGAEALGNILIEFYAQSCEVIAMSTIDSKLDLLVKSASFRVESDSFTLTKDELPSSGSTITVHIPCSNGAKMATFYADETTRNKVKATTDIGYITAAILNCFEDGIKNMATTTKSYMVSMQNTTSGWMLNDGSTTATNTNGIEFKGKALMAGTYHWTAYYWD